MEDQDAIAEEAQELVMEVYKQANETNVFLKMSGWTRFLSLLGWHIKDPLIKIIKIAAVIKTPQTI